MTETEALRAEGERLRAEMKAERAIKAIDCEMSEACCQCQALRAENQSLRDFRDSATVRWTSKEYENLHVENRRLAARVEEARALMVRSIPFLPSMGPLREDIDNWI
jgi:PhoPQ-activated pathogenicity-related protein